MGIFAQVIADARPRNSAGMQGATAQAPGPAAEAMGRPTLDSTPVSAGGAVPEPADRAAEAAPPPAPVTILEGGPTPDTGPDPAPDMTADAMAPTVDLTAVPQGPAQVDFPAHPAIPDPVPLVDPPEALEPPSDGIVIVAGPAEPEHGGRPSDIGGQDAVDGRAASLDHRHDEPVAEPDSDGGADDWPAAEPVRATPGDRDHTGMPLPVVCESELDPRSVDDPAMTAPAPPPSWDTATGAASAGLAAPRASGGARAADRAPARLVTLSRHAPAAKPSSRDTGQPPAADEASEPNSLPAKGVSVSPLGDRDDAGSPVARSAAHPDARPFAAASPVAAYGTLEGDGALRPLPPERAPAIARNEPAAAGPRGRDVEPHKPEPPASAAPALPSIRTRGAADHRSPGPSLHIGQIDVIIEAPPAAPAASARQTEAAPSDMASRLYLRRL